MERCVARIVGGSGSGFRPASNRHQGFDAIAAAGKSEFQMAELTELRQRATEGQLAHATGETIAAALAALEPLCVRFAAGASGKGEAERMAWLLYIYLIMSVIISVSALIHAGLGAGV
jgi:hypothetical protein